MLSSFQPSKAKPIDYVEVFRAHICSTPQGSQGFARVEPTFQRLRELRNGFIWDNIVQSDMFNKPQMRTVQDNLEEYLRYCIFLNTKFTFGGKSGVKDYTSDWMMSWTGEKVKSDLMEFEISNMLFNYGILNFNQAVIYLKSKHTKEEYKGSLEKLRYAKWAFKELMKISEDLAKKMKIPLELRPVSLEFMLGLMEGLSYLCFFFMFEDEQNPAVTGENLAALEREVAKWFFLCRKSLNSNKDLKKIMANLVPDVLGYYYEYNYNCLIRTIQILGAKQEAEINKGWIGIQYAYMLEVESLFKQLGRDEKFPAKAALEARYKKDIPSLMTATKTKIDQVYKCLRTLECLLQMLLISVSSCPRRSKE
jgi:BRO1-like domain